MTAMFGTLVLAMLLAATPAALAQVACPISSEAASKLNFKPLAQACNDVYLPALDAGKVSAANVSAASDVITACTTAYVARFVLAGVEVRNLVALQTCNFTDGASLPACLKGKFGGANETVTASNGADDLVYYDDPEVTASDRAENTTTPVVGIPARVAQVFPSAVPGNTTFTLAGTISDVSSFIRAMVDSADLRAALAPEVQAQFDTLKADPERLDNVEAAKAIVGAVNNPVSAEPVIQKLYELQQAAPPTPAADAGAAVAAVPSDSAAAQNDGSAAPSSSSQAPAPPATQSGAVAVAASGATGFALLTAFLLV